MRTLPRTTRTAARHATWIATVLVATACSGGSSNTQPGTLAIDLAPDAITVDAGDQGTTTLGVTRGGGFSGDVTLSAQLAPSGSINGVSADALPSGITVSFDPNPVPGSSTSSTVTVQVDESVAGGTYPIEIDASGTGVTTQKATLTLTVPSSGAGSIALAAGTNPVNVTAGAAAATSVITLTRTAPFAGAVAMTVTGMPPNMTASFNPTSIAAGSTTSTLSVSATTALANGDYQLTVRGAGTGVADATVNVTAHVTGGATGSITLTAGTNPVNVTAGAAAATSVITIARTAPFTGAVALTVTGMPANMTATLNPTSVASGSTTSTLSISATTAVTNGDYPLTVKGTGTGIPDKTVAVTAHVTGGVSAGITFAFNPTSLSMQAGTAAKTSAITITRTGGFTGGVNFTVTGQPSGMTAGITPANPITGNTATLSVTAGSSVTAGTYSLSIKGSGTGIPDHTMTFGVTVTGGSSGSITVTVCPTNAPVWVAGQAGTGPWTQIIPSGNTYTFNIGDKGGIATVTPVDGAPGKYNFDVLYASRADFQNFFANSLQFNCGVKTLHGSVANVSATQTAVVSLGSASAFVNGAGGTTFELDSVENGALDLVASRANFGVGGLSVDKFIIRDGVNLADGGTIPVLDFGAAEAFGPDSAKVTVSQAAAVGSGFFSTTTQAFTVGVVQAAANTATTYQAIPTAKLSASQYEVLFASPTAAGDGRAAYLYFRTVANRTITFGPALSMPTVTKAATTPYLRPQAVFASQPQYNTLVEAEFSQGGNASSTVIMTSNYLGATPASWTLTVPDVSAAAGWNNAYGLANTPFDWSTDGFGGRIFFFDQTVPPDGTTGLSARQQSSAPVSSIVAQHGLIRMPELPPGRNR